MTKRKNKSEFSGHCQCCGRLQKLPGNVLSKHGYTKRWGFFEGTCPGAHRMPFEISCDMLPEFIASAERQIAHIESTQAKIRATAAPAAWVQEYILNGKRGYGQSGKYVYSEKQITATFHKFSDGDGGYNVFKFVPSEGAMTSFNGDQLRGEFRDTLEIVCAKYNDQYAATFDKKVGQLREYIAWQRDRIVGWKLAALTSVK